MQLFDSNYEIVKFAQLAFLMLCSTINIVYNYNIQAWCITYGPCSITLPYVILIPKNRLPSLIERRLVGHLTQ